MSALLATLLGVFLDDPQQTAQIAACYALRDMHIDASLADDMPAATLANLLIYPTDSELYNNPWIGEDGRLID